MKRHSVVVPEDDGGEEMGSTIAMLEKAMRALAWFCLVMVLLQTALWLFEAREVWRACGWIFFLNDANGMPACARW